ncbi:hypothetical protein [Streptomyces sp. NPDC050738]|uniref:hypothetical protein n=1 Tax=Streptomyces sp. NPDC050738 TaxID=3154744 RepID=UPI003440177B
MAIELPGEVVSFLQFIGVNWPTVNEDKVREFASHVREFGTKLGESEVLIPDAIKVEPWAG